MILFKQSCHVASTKSLSIFRPVDKVLRNMINRNFDLFKSR